MIGLLDMSNEILLLICQFLMMPDVARLAFTCKELLPVLTKVKEDREFREVHFDGIVTYNAMIDLPIYSFVKCTRDGDEIFQIEGYNRYHEARSYLGSWQAWMDDRPMLSVSESRTAMSPFTLKVDEEHYVLEPFSDSMYEVRVIWIQTKGM